MQLHLQNVPGDNVADICKAAGVKRWLESSGTLCEVTYLGTSQYLALAHKRGVAVVQLGTRESGGVLREKARVPFRRFNTLSCEGDVTAMHWIRVGQGSAKTPLLLVGTKNGALIVLSHRTALLHRQELSAHAISCIQDRRRQDKAEEVLLLSSPNTLVTLSTTPLCGLADARYLEPVSDDDKARRPTDSDPFSEDVLDYAISASTYSIHAPLSGGLPCVFHKLASQGGEAASMMGIVPVGKVRPDPFEVNTQVKWVVAGGKLPSLAAFKTAGESTAGGSDSAWKVASAALSFAKVSFLGRPAKAKPAAPVTATADREFEDKREFESLAVDCTGRYVAASDNLGRVAVVDTSTFTVVRMLKGYRQASVLWLPPSRLAGYMFLVYLPRRGIVEVWSLGSQQRVAAATIGFNCQVRHTGRRDDMSCIVVQTDGSTSHLKLSADSAVASYAEEAPTSLRVWREACQADDADLDTLSAVLGTFTNTVEILECIVTMPVSLGHVLWIDCTAAALMILEKRGIGQEDIVTGDTVGMEQMFTSGDRLVTEQERLMGTDAPLLTEGMVYMYLVNRLSVLNAYIMALSQVRKPRNIDAPTIAQQWHDLFSEIDFGEGPLNPPVAALARVSTKSGRDQKQPEMPLPEFLSYFDMLSKAAKIVKVDEKLSEFICHSLTEGSIDIFANCAHILSLDNSLVLQMVVLWGAKPRSVRSTMPVDNFSRLVGAPVAEQVADDVPEWLLSMSGRDSLLHAAYIIAAARKRLIETDPDDAYRLEGVEDWLCQVLSLVHLMGLLSTGSAWTQEIKLSCVHEIPPSALIAAHCLQECEVCDDRLTEYIQARRGEDAFHAHSAMYFVYAYVRRVVEPSLLRCHLFSPAWVLCADEVFEQYSQDTSVKEADLLQKAFDHLDRAGPLAAPVTHWCCAVLLVNIAAVVHVSRMRRVTPAAACQECGMDPALLVQHLQLTKPFLHRLSEDIEPIEEGTSWWGQRPYDVMVNGSIDAAHAASLRDFGKEELLLVVEFIHESLQPDVMALEALSAAGSLRMGKLFTKHSLQLLQPTSKVFSPTADGDGALEKSRVELVLCALRGAPTAAMHGLGERLLKCLDVPQSDEVLFEVVARHYYEGLDVQAIEILGGEDTCRFPEEYTKLLINVLRVRLKHVLSSPVAGNSTQNRAERSLNLVSSVPLELVEWVNVGDSVSEEDAERVALWNATIPRPVACQRLKLLSIRTKQRAVKLQMGQNMLDKLQKAIEFTDYLARNV